MRSLLSRVGVPRAKITPSCLSAAIASRSPFTRPHPGARSSPLETLHAEHGNHLPSLANRGANWRSADQGSIGVGHEIMSTVPFGTLKEVSRMNGSPPLTTTKRMPRSLPRYRPGPGQRYLSASLRL